MHPISFEGSSEIRKPSSMTDEQCMSVWAKRGFIELTNIMEEMELRTLPPHDINFDPGTKCIYYLTAWKPNKEDLDALNRGEPIFIKTLSEGLPPMAVFTLDENNEGNF